MEDKFIADFILKYCEKQSTPNTLRTSEIYQHTLTVPKGYMCIGPLPGFILRSYLLTKRPKFILEIGAFTGYVLSILDEYSGADITIISIEDNYERYQAITQRFTKEVSSGKIRVFNQEGTAYLEKNDDILFDMMFIDGRKETFYDKLDLLYSRLQMNGLIIADNALAGLKVFSPEKHWEKCTVEFNEYLKNDERFISTILPLRDGFNIALKIK